METTAEDVTEVTDWSNDFNGISICYDDRVVRIKTDRYLLDFLGRPGNGALELSAYMGFAGAIPCDNLYGL